ncbi:hypothetical protein, partial [Arthrobacter sp. H5]|uniref:hypothetical protein n=1 Tax=Arthrobacter sp. H5 TaxID=1267973 RepID=UPI000566A606
MTQPDPVEEPFEFLTSEVAAAQLHTVLSLAEQGKLRVSAKTRRPASSTVKLLGDALPGGDYYPHTPIAAYAWPLLLQAGGMADGS